MNIDLRFLGTICIYIVCAKMVLTLLRGKTRDNSFALINLVFVASLFSWGFYYSSFIVYVVLFVLHFLLICKCKSNKLFYYAGLIYPVIILFVLKYLPEDFYRNLRITGIEGGAPVAFGLVGLSYMAFRSSYLTVEVKTGAVALPSLSKYLGFCFFLPTMTIGPISRYSAFEADWTDDSTKAIAPLQNSIYRIVIGLVKYLYFANLFSQLDFNGLLLDGKSHPPIDLFIAGVGFYLYLYCNFSGFCDVAVGLAGLLGFRLNENFNNPFVARNLQDFWNRWHITLNIYMRDIVFTPLSKVLVRKFGPKQINLAVTFALFAVFVLIGVWHGKELQYVLFGLIHAFGVALAFWYGVALRKLVGSKGFKSYLKNKFFRSLAVSLTFSYVSLSFAIFANSPAQLRDILDRIGC